MRRLVFLTQSVDPAHPVLAATIPKIRALAERVDEVVVVAQSGGGDGLPGNVQVRTFGAPSRAQRVWRFERELARALPADAVRLSGAVGTPTFGVADDSLDGGEKPAAFTALTV